ncbi:MAG: SO_0444 family Cu/Zn efflux transporter, partial [Phycisphaerae bacterium]|nr:SO_0444 family Cu/Zn efflux transporter [Phycisphaerae bacterium]
VIRLLSAARSRSVLLAALIGLPLPLCSCSVLPAAIALRRKGASKGATLSFLISTPETSVTSVLLTYGLLGPVMAIVRPVAAAITAVVAGLVETAFERRDGGAAEGVSGASESGGCPHCAGVEEAADELQPIQARLRGALRYAFVDLFDDIFGWVLIGILAAAAIQALLPGVVLSTLFRGSLQSMLVMVVLGIPLYVCAEGSTPIAAALIAQGVSPGAGLVLLLVGPATNIGSLGVLRGVLGRRTVVVYLASIIVVALAAGAVLDNWVSQSGSARHIQALSEPFVPQSVKIAGAIAFLLLCVLSMRRRRYVERIVRWLNERLPVRVSFGRLALAALLAAAAGWLAGGFFCVQPEEVGIVKRFGAIHRTGLAPGLHYAWPYPIESVDRIAVRRVYRTVLGYQLHPEKGIPTSASETDESWSLVGDENIADIKTAVLWGADDRAEQAILQFAYGMTDRERSVRSAVQAACREVLGAESINEVFTARRRAAATLVLTGAQAKLDAWGCGIRIHGCYFLDAHAPREVHDAFRDVAGAMEDKATRIDKALAEEARIVPAARGRAAEMQEEARGYAVRLVESARGEAERFLQLWNVALRWPEVTRRRLYHETLDTVLPGVPKYIRPAGVAPDVVELWLTDTESGWGFPGVPPQPSRER